MDPTRWQRVKNLYHAASAQAIGERAAFLAEASQGDDALLREVQRLLEQPLETAAVFVAGTSSVEAHEVRDLTGTRQCVVGSRRG